MDFAWPAPETRGLYARFDFMPIYEYQCAACGKVAEILQKLSDPAPSKCESCGSGPLSKLISQTSFVLNGTGWYVTDFRGGKKPGDGSGPDKK
jgi:putative FmdB family regulatory protein